ncbi:ichor, partial [Cardiocondyla obscurior]|uniref:ichor n=1 Tax=Cardiocondyla obscurior TaxID=286306 RepID=UPI0039655B50
VPGCHSSASGCSSDSARDSRSTLPPSPEFYEQQPASRYSGCDRVYEASYQIAGHQPLGYDGNFQGYQNSLYSTKCPPNDGEASARGVLNPSCCYKLPSSPESLGSSPTNSVVSAPSLSPYGAPNPCAYPGNRGVFRSEPAPATFTTSPTSTNARSIVANDATSATASLLYREELPSPSYGTRTEFHGVCPGEQQQFSSGPPPSSRFGQPSYPPYGTTSNALKILSSANLAAGGDGTCVDRGGFLKEYSLRAISVKEEQHKLQQAPGNSSVVPGYRHGNVGLFAPLELKEEPAVDANVAGTVAPSDRGGFKQQSFCASRSTGDASLVVKSEVLPHYLNTISPTSDIVTEMKYETQSGPPAAPPHLTSSGVEPPHSSQGTGIVVGSSPGEIDSLLLPWTNGPEYMEGGVTDAKQTAVAFQDNWDSLLGTTVSEQSLPDVKLLPLPPFTNYTGHLQINGIPGHHYHTIASSGQRSSIEVGSASPTPSSNQEFFESPVVSSSTPCPQASQKQQQQAQQPQQNHQPPQHHHPHNQQQQQLPQSTQQIIYEDMEDIAQIIGSAIADTTVPGNGNGPNSEQDTDTSRDWIDIADWITDCSPKTQETTSPSTFVSHQIYVTTTPSTQTQQHASSALQNLLTQKLDYAPLLQARLQAGNANLQNTSCGETPSSTSPYPPLSPNNRVSTSCSPDDILHSSFAAPSHPRKRSRSSPGSGSAPSKKGGPAAGAAALPYGTESSLMSGKDKPIHRCHICQRGFLNKSNIKVHLRTHTGEKPFRCDVCSKAFRQKAHLIKHQQIHKRIGRD